MKNESHSPGSTLGEALKLICKALLKFSILVFVGIAKIVIVMLEKLVEFIESRI